jgi:hypothetical protein
MFNTENFKCGICMGHFKNPVITQCGKIYCENCIKEWNAKNNKSPTDGPLITNWIRSPMVESLCLFPRVYTDHKLVYISEDLGFVCSNKEECEQILTMIDEENHDRLNQDFENTVIMIKLFSNGSLVKQILNNISDSWQGVDGWSIEHYIARFGNVDMIENMITNKSNLYKLAHRNNRTPLDFILSKHAQMSSADQLKIIELLLKSGIDFNGSTALILRIFSNDNNLNSSDQLKAFNILLPSLNDINCVIHDSAGWRMIHFICSQTNNLESNDQLKAIELYLSCQGIDLNARIHNGWSPIHFLTGGCNKLNQSDQISAIRLLLNHDIDLENKIDRLLWQPIHFLCSYEGNLSKTHRL